MTINEQQPDITRRKLITGSVVAATAIGISLPHISVAQSHAVTMYTDVSTYLNVDLSGRTDSTAGIQQAIDDTATKGGGVVYFPTGTYLIGTEVGLLLQSKVSLQGVNHSAVLILAHNSPIPGSHAMVRAYLQEDLAIHNLRFDGNRGLNNANQNNLISLIKFDQCKRVIVDNCFLEDSTNVGIYAATGSKDVRITNNIAKNVYGGAYRVGGKGDENEYLYAERILIHGNIAVNDVAHTSQEDGFIAVKYNARNISISNNQLINHDATSIAFALWLTDKLENVKIDNNIIYKINGSEAAIRVDHHFSNLSITNNTIEDCVSAISIRDNVIGNNLKITHNQILNTTSESILIREGSSITVNHVLISNNQILGTLSWHILNIAAHHLTVANNQLSFHTSSTPHYAIASRGNHCSFINNDIECANSNKSGIQLTGNNNIVTNNSIRNTGTSWAVNAQGTQNNIINNNIFSNTANVRPQDKYLDNLML